MTRKLLVVFILISFVSFGQELTNHFDANYFHQQRFAHRGGYAIGPENTLQTILSNIAFGVTAIEIDIHLTKDNELVLFHDEPIKRLLNSDSDRTINDFTLSELKSIPLRDSTRGVQYVCSLAELIDTLVVLIPMRHRLDFLLEIDFKPNGEKTEKAVDALLTILNNHLPEIGSSLYNFFFVSTFYPDVLKELHERDPKIKTAFAVNNVPPTNKLKARIAVLVAPIIVKKYGVSIFEPNMCMLTERYLRKWLKRGCLINAYTANTPCEKAYLESLHVAYTTNCPFGTCDPDPSDWLGKPKKWCKSCSK